MIRKIKHELLHVRNHEIQQIMSTASAPTPEKSTLSSIDDPGAGNPCPFLRALVSRGSLNKNYDKPNHIAKVIHDVAKCGYSPAPDLYKPAISFVATIANGMWPWQVAHNLWYGTHLSNLRGGMLDKKGGGSQIFSEKGMINKAQLERMASFGSEKVDAQTGYTEVGLNMKEINNFIDANANRAKDLPGALSPRLCKIFASQEYPVLLRVMGKPGKDGERYLSMAEVISLWEERKLPSRFNES